MQWLAVGLVAYAALILLVLSLARAARAADRSERAVFQGWLDERRGRAVELPVLRGGRRPKAA